MLKLKEIEKMFPESERSEDGQMLYIKACDVGDNFYDYDDERKAVVYDPQYEFLKDDHRICIVECCVCCGCSGW